MPSVEPNTGFEATTMRSRPEPRSSQMLNCLSHPGALPKGLVSDLQAICHTSAYLLGNGLVFEVNVQNSCYIHKMFPFKFHFYLLSNSLLVQEDPMVFFGKRKIKTELLFSAARVCSGINRFDRIWGLFFHEVKRATGNTRAGPRALSWKLIQRWTPHVL